VFYVRLVFISYWEIFLLWMVQIKILCVLGIFLFYFFEYLFIPRITYRFLPNIFIIIHAWPSCLYCPIAVATIRIPGSIVDIKPMEFTWPWHATEEHCGSPEVGAEINSIFATKRDYMLPKIVVFGFAMDCKVQAST